MASSSETPVGPSHARSGVGHHQHRLRAGVRRSAFLLGAFEGTDKAYSWERRGARGRYLLCFQALKSCLFEQRHKIMHPASSGVKARSPTRPVGFVCEVSNDQAPSRFEHTSDFRDPLTFE